MHTGKLYGSLKKVLANPRFKWDSEKPTRDDLGRRWLTGEDRHLGHRVRMEIIAPGVRRGRM